MSAIKPTIAQAIADKAYIDARITEYTAYLSAYDPNRTTPEEITMLKAERSRMRALSTMLALRVRASGGTL